MPTRIPAPDANVAQLALGLLVAVLGVVGQSHVVAQLAALLVALELVVSARNVEALAALGLVSIRIDLGVVALGEMPGVGSDTDAIPGAASGGDWEELEGRHVGEGERGGL